MMGNLIRFDSRRRVIPGHDHPKGEAQVLMFTGVRYERTGNGSADETRVKVGKPAQRRKRKHS